MLLKNLETLQKTLTSHPKVEVKHWEVGPPATDAQIEAFKKSVLQTWREVPESILDVYRQANGFHFRWKHESGVGGSMKLLPLGEISAYNQIYDFTDHVDIAARYFVLDQYEAEYVAGLVLPKNGKPMLDKMVHHYFRDEDGEPTKLALAQYVEKVLQGWGLQDVRMVMLDSDFLSDNYDVEGKGWPFETIDAYLAATDADQRLEAAIDTAPRNWVAELKDFGYEIFSANSLYDFREWMDLNPEAITSLQLKCNANTVLTTAAFPGFPNLGKLHLYQVAPATNLEGLSRCSQLEELHLEYSDLTAAIPELDRQVIPTVKTLSVGGEGKHWNWRFLAKFPALQSLRLLGRLLAMGDAIKGMTGKNQTFKR